MLNEVKEFSDKYQLRHNDRPGLLSEIEMQRRLAFQFEELQETAAAMGFIFDPATMRFERAPGLAPDLAEILDGLVDQVYVALGTAYLMGMNNPIFAIAWDRVHRANMQKEIIPGQWKIQKPKGWKRPDLSDLVE